MKTENEVIIDILKHIVEVQENLSEMRYILEKRGLSHDKSKLTEIELDGFVLARPKFKKANYGTPEYQECVDMIKPSIDHHYSVNRHHVAFHKNGFADMNLFDIMEMLADWKAASKRSPDLTFKDSLPTTFKKYKIPENMQKHILSTFEELGWVKGDK